MSSSSSMIYGLSNPVAATAGGMTVHQQVNTPQHIENRCRSSNPHSVHDNFLFQYRQANYYSSSSNESPPTSEFVHPQHHMHQHSHRNSPSSSPLAMTTSSSASFSNSSPPVPVPSTTSSYYSHHPQSNSAGSAIDYYSSSFSTSASTSNESLVGIDGLSYTNLDTTNAGAYNQAAAHHGYHHPLYHHAPPPPYEIITPDPIHLHQAHPTSVTPPEYGHQPSANLYGHHQFHDFSKSQNVNGIDSRSNSTESGNNSNDGVADHSHGNLSLLPPPQLFQHHNQHLQHQLNHCEMSSASATYGSVVHFNNPNNSPGAVSSASNPANQSSCLMSSSPITASSASLLAHQHSASHNSQNISSGSNLIPPSNNFHYHLHHHHSNNIGINGSHNTIIGVDPLRLDLNGGVSAGDLQQHQQHVPFIKTEPNLQHPHNLSGTSNSTLNGSGLQDFKQEPSLSQQQQSSNSNVPTYKWMQVKRNVPKPPYPQGKHFFQLLRL